MLGCNKAENGCNVELAVGVVEVDIGACCSLCNVVGIGTEVCLGLFALQFGWPGVLRLKSYGVEVFANANLNNNQKLNVWRKHKIDMFWEDLQNNLLPNTMCVINLDLDPLGSFLGSILEDT